MTETLLWIIGSGLAMSAIALSGSVTLVLEEKALNKILLPLVAFAAGSLIGGAFFHMIPSSLARFQQVNPVFLWLIGGFIVFFRPGAVSPLAPLPPEACRPQGTRRLPHFDCGRCAQPVGRFGGRHRLRYRHSIGHNNMVGRSRP